MLDFRLKAFISVAKNKNFTKAANELHVTQPAISKQIKDLENIYNVQLIERNNSESILTQTGEVFLSHAEKIIEDYNQLQYEMNKISKTFDGELHIGASTTIGQYIIPSLLSQFMRTYPDYNIDLINGNSQEIEKALIEKRIDIGLVEGLHQNPSIKYIPFLKDEIVLVTKPTSIFGKLDTIDISKLMVMPIVLREFGSGTLEVINGKLNEKGTSIDDMNILLHLGNSESIKNFLQINDCVALISIRAVINELKSGILKVIDINGINFERNLRFCMPYGVNNPAIETFIKFACNHNKTL